MATKRTDKKPLEIRGIMLDSARLMERHEFYFALLPQLAEWGINTLWWHFIDDQGFGVKLDSHPELATPFAFSKPEVRRFIETAAAVGIDVVPEVETLGHAGYLLRLPQYAHLADGNRAGFNAACPSQPQTLELMSEIVTEVAELFPSEYLHAGLDEVNFGECKRCARRGRGKPKWWVYAEHVKAMHKIITGLGKRMVMWADHIEDAPAMLKKLPKDILMAHWQYAGADTTIRPRLDPVVIERSLDAGFECVGAPAMAWFGTMIQPRACDLDVMDGMAFAASRLRRKGMRGMVNTWWIPGRILRDTGLMAAAYTGEILNAGGGVDRHAFARRFAKRYFGLADAKASRALMDMHALAPNMNELEALLCETTSAVVDAVAMARDEGFGARAERIDACVVALTAARTKVKRNVDVYDAHVLAARIAAACMDNARKMLVVYDACWRAGLLRNAKAPGSKVAQRLAPAVEAFEAMVAAIDEMAKLTAVEWDRTRHSRDAAKHVSDAASTPCGRAMLLGRLARSRIAIRQRRAGFVKALAVCRRGGPVPSWG